MKEDLIKYLKDFLVGNDWSDTHTKEQARAIFTTICLIWYIDADTSECDDILSFVYDSADISEQIDFDDLAIYKNFKSYMLALIV